MNRTCAICKTDKDLNDFYNGGSWFCIKCLKQRSIDDRNALNDRYIKNRIRMITDLGNKEMHYSIIHEMREWIIKCDNLKDQDLRECYRCKYIKPIKSFAKTMNICRRCKYKEKKEREAVQIENLEDTHVKYRIAKVTGLSRHEMHPLLIKEGRSILKRMATYHNHSRLRLCYACNKAKKRNLFAKSICMECTKKRDNETRKVHRDSCSDGYIKSLFCNHGGALRRADIPKGLVDIKKEEILLNRTVKKIKQKEKEK
tara:strand:- start:93 stop:863 length:771 start_codon:yes stop_codon:yes gene_type:complete